MQDHDAAIGSDARALAGAAGLGSLVALVIGGAYLAGGFARDQVAHDRIAQLASSTGAGFSEAALAKRPDPGALAILRRQAPVASLRDGPGARKLAALEARLAALRGAENAPAAPPVLKTLTSNPAEPFHLRGALGDSRDLDCLTQVVYYEARGEGRDGEAAVAQVVLNRVRHPAFPKSVCGVVFQRAAGGCQFSFACNGAANRAVESLAWRQARKVAAGALGGVVMADVGEATHFHAARSSGFTTGLLKVAQIGAHVFYRFGGRSGAPAAFHGEPQVSASEPPRVYASFAPVGAKVDAGKLLASASAAVQHVAEAASHSLAGQAQAATVVATAAPAPTAGSSALEAMPKPAEPEAAPVMSAAPAKPAATVARLDAPA